MSEKNNNTNEVNKDLPQTDSQKANESSFDVFADRRDDDVQERIPAQGEVSVYTTDYPIFRNIASKSADRDYYNYALGFYVTINGKKIAQTIYLEPTRKTSDNYDLLDAIFGDSVSHNLEIVKRTTTTYVNNTSKTTVSYGIRVSETDESGVVLACTLNVTRGNTDKFNNLIEILKKRGIIS